VCVCERERERVKCSAVCGQKECIENLREKEFVCSVCEQSRERERKSVRVSLWIKRERVSGKNDCVCVSVHMTVREYYCVCDICMQVRLRSCVSQSQFVVEREQN